MSVKFCSNCGNKFEYKYSPPKFCSNCGEPTGSVSKSSSKSKEMPSVNVKRSKISQLNENETDAEFVPQIDKLDFEIEDYSTATTIGDLFGKPNNGGHRRRQAKSMEEFLNRD